jgi:hypothetical protein
VSDFRECSVQTRSDEIAILHPPFLIVARGECARHTRKDNSESINSKRSHHVLKPTHRTAVEKKN